MELEENYEKKEVDNINVTLALITASFTWLTRKITHLLYFVENDIDPVLKERFFNKQLTAIIGTFSMSAQNAIEKGMIANWKLANAKNDELVRAYLAGIKAKEKAAYFANNIPALREFLKRVEDGMDLSKRVWNITAGFKEQLTEYVGTGILKGRSSGTIAMDIRQLVREPDKLFRRVRGETGKLKLSKAAKDYHPGQGVYRSTFKNAHRLAATEVNMAYRMSDYTRRQQLDFIMGIRIHLSRSHPRPDICDHMKGDYPKDFMYRGWHPWCLCYTTSILMSGREYRCLQELNNRPKRMVKEIL